MATTFMALPNEPLKFYFIKGFLVFEDIIFNI